MNLKLLFTLLFFLSIASGVLSAQTDSKTSIPELLLQWNTDLMQSAQTLAEPNIDEAALKGLSEQLTKIRDNARVTRNKINLLISPLQDQLTALGSLPTEGAPAESASISANRKSLNAQLADLQGQLKQTGLVISSAEDSLEHLSVMRIHLFTKKIFSRGLSALAPEVWQKGLPDLQGKLNTAKSQIETWQSEHTIETLKPEILRLLITLLANFAIVLPFSRWFSKQFGRTSKLPIPTYVELLRAAIAFAIVRSLLPMSIVTSVYLLFNHDFQWLGTSHDFAYTVLQASLMIILVAAISRAMLAPSNGRWRLMPLNDADARYVHKVIVNIVWVFAIDLIFKVWFAANGASIEVTILRQFFIGLLITGLLSALLIRRQLWRMDIQHRRKISNKSRIWRSLRVLIAGLVLMIPISAIAGFVAFSRLLGTQIVLTGTLYFLVGIIIALSNELIEELLSKDEEMGSKIRHTLDLTDEGSEILVFWLQAAANSIIYISGILTLLVIWGAGGQDLNAWLYSAIFGFNIAGVTISISTLFLAIILFSGTLLLTRILQRFLENVVLPRTLVDVGIQNSIRASVGYIGFILAAGLAISTLGIDLSKLAIIAGALSVGIGFGLQNVVNNFVSGLILLIERPIKVGDWVVVNDQQGYVKNINVRATEIQTFDRASVFIPNSNLISNPVLNWTHADKTGRVIVPIGVAYGTDTRKVQTLLLEVATAHPAVLNTPTSSVLFKGFGDSCLNFELRTFVQDIDKVATVSSDLCFEIDAAFRHAGIEIPYPQQDVHWRDMERLENLVIKILTEKKA